jgi:hypothetical protein
VAIHRYPNCRKFDVALFLPTPAGELVETERHWIRALCPIHNKRDNPRPDPTAISWGERYGDGIPCVHFDSDPELFRLARGSGGPKRVMEYREKHGVYARVGGGTVPKVYAGPEFWDKRARK